MFDIVTALQALDHHLSHSKTVDDIDQKTVRRALSEIERLRAQVGSLTATLTRIADTPAHHAGQTSNELHFQEWAKEALAMSASFPSFDREEG